MFFDILEKYAEKYGLVIVLIDEADALLDDSKEGHVRKFVKKLQSEMEGTRDLRGVLIVATTNR